MPEKLVLREKTGGVFGLDCQFKRRFCQDEETCISGSRVRDGRRAGLAATFTPGEYEATAQGFAGAVTVKVTVDEAYTLGNAFKVMGNNSFCYLLMVITGLSYLTILVLIALIINSLRKSIRDEQPLRHSNILRTRAIGILILVGELSEAFMKYLNNNEAVRLLEGTSFEVVQTFPLSYWNVIVGILFLFMAEVLSLGTQLSEEQKLTI